MLAPRPVLQYLVAQGWPVVRWPVVRWPVVRWPVVRSSGAPRLTVQPVAAPPQRAAL
jgi:hypothetical protein